MDTTELGTRRNMGNVRRYIWWSLGASPLVAALPTGTDLIVQSYGPLRSTLGWLALVLLALEFGRLLSAVMRDQASRIPVWEPALVGALMLAEYADMVPRGNVGEFWALLPASIVGIAVLLVPTAKRLLLAVVGCALIGVTGMLSVGVRGSSLADIGHALLGAVLATLFMVLLSVSSAHLWGTVMELDRQRKASAELAVAEERLRFAADLHDIQGNHLQAIALKGELAERLIGHDDEAARKQAAEIAELARTALSDTRAVVQNYRKTDLGTEITNAVGILDAAGIRVTVDGAARDVPVAVQPLFGALVREGTTNLLRHSHAETASLRMAVTDGLVTATLSNDGLSGTLSTTDGSGLDGLRQRFASVGGRVDVSTRDGRFELTASVPEGGGS